MTRRIGAFGWAKPPTLGEMTKFERAAALVKSGPAGPESSGFFFRLEQLVQLLLIVFHFAFGQKEGVFAV